MLAEWWSMGAGDRGITPSRRTRMVLRGFWRNMKFPGIISGGQTGAERMALDWAIRIGYQHGGWCPRGRAAEDSRIPDDYWLRQTRSSAGMECVEKNVTRSNATAVFTSSAKPHGRVNQELKLRTRVASLLPNEASLLRLVTALLAERSEEWETGKVYLNMENHAAQPTT